MIELDVIDTVVLDARPLSQIVHPRKFMPIQDWLDDVLELGIRVVIPEVVDYEVRRGLLRIPAERQLQRLDAMAAVFHLDPITRPIMHDAAHVWARARNMGKPFTSDDRLDGDAILIAQVRALGDLRKVVTITENVRHLDPFIPAVRWQDFKVEE